MTPFGTPSMAVSVRGGKGEGGRRRGWRGEGRDEMERESEREEGGEEVKG